MLTLALLAIAAIAARAAVAPSFTTPAPGPEATSSVYTGTNNNTLSNGPLVPGTVFDRFIQIWLENTDYATAASSPFFQSLLPQSLLLSSYYAVTHPSEPNYMAVAGGSFFGDASDNFRHIPANISCVVDILEAAGVSWASYQENMPYDGYTAYNYSQPNYVQPGTGDYVYYVRKHNPLIIYDSVANNTQRALRIRNYNDFSADLNASALPQWIFMTPNLMDDAHDTTIDYTSAYLQWWLPTLLADTRFNDNRTLILLTFDETETYTVPNTVFTLVLGGALPAALRGTTDPTFYTHYSALSTVQANWGLQSLGRADANATLNNVLAFVAAATGWSNNGLTAASPALPWLNDSGTYPGPLNPALYTLFPAPDAPAAYAGPGRNGVLVPAGTLTAQTAAALAGSAVNLTAQGWGDTPWAVDPGFDYPDGVKVQAAPVSSGVVPSASASAAASAARRGAPLRGGAAWAPAALGALAGALLVL